jgi:MYXO-CTERM domain-containing protein
MRVWVLLSIASVLSACALSKDTGKRSEAIAEEGPWHIPADTLAIGDTQWVENTQAGPWRGESGCGGGILAGASEFRDWLRVAFPQIDSIGGYSCRPIVGAPGTMSVHATGRALDVMISTVSGSAADNTAGDPIGNWLIENAEYVGIQYIIWDRWQWNGESSAGSKSRAYTGEHPHNDHLHVELSVEAAMRGTDWFTGPRDLPGMEDCMALPTGGGIVEESSDCFRAFGPSEYWRHETTGMGGSLLWTNAFESATPSNWARWYTNLTEAGDYAVDVYIEPGYGVHDAVKYTLRHDGGESDVVIDQSTASGWTRLGVFAFAAGTGQFLDVFDNASGPVMAESRIAVDAIRVSVAEPGSGYLPQYMVTGDMADEVEPVDVGELPPPGGEGEDPTALSGSCSAGGSSLTALPIALLGLGLVALRRRRR